MSYAKLHRDIVTSSIWGEPLHVRVVWITFMALADSDGLVFGSPSGMARQCAVSREEFDQAMAVLGAPDPDSTSPDEGGRRIVEEVIGGRHAWRLVTYQKYRRLCDAEERKARNAEIQAAKRARAREEEGWASPESQHASPPVSTRQQPSASVTTCQQPSPAVSTRTEMSRQAEAEAEADAPPEATQDPVCKVDAEDLTGSGGPVSTQPQPPTAPDVDRGVHIPCPPASELLTPEQRKALEVALIPGWAIDAIVAEFAARYAADQTERRTLVRWRKGCAQAVSGNWNNPNRRPRKPEPDGSPPTSHGRSIPRKHNDTPEDVKAYIDRTHGRGAA